MDRVVIMHKLQDKTEIIAFEAISLSWEDLQVLNAFQKLVNKNLEGTQSLEINVKLNFFKRPKEEFKS